MEVILATAFGQKIEILQGEANDLTRAAKAVIDGFSHLRGPMLLAAILGELYMSLHISAACQFKAV